MHLKSNNVCVPIIQNRASQFALSLAKVVVQCFIVTAFYTGKEQPYFYVDQCLGFGRCNFDSWPWPKQLGKFEAKGRAFNMLREECSCMFTTPNRKYFIFWACNFHEHAIRIPITCTVMYPPPSFTSVSSKFPIRTLRNDLDKE